VYWFFVLDFCLRARKKRMKAFSMRFKRLRTMWFLER
jgi:hypothetical protein